MNDDDDVNEAGILQLTFSVINTGEHEGGTEED